MFTFLKTVALWSSRNVIWSINLHLTFHQHEGEQMTTGFSFRGWTVPLICHVMFNEIFLFLCFWLQDISTKAEAVDRLSPSLLCCFVHFAKINIKIYICHQNVCLSPEKKKHKKALMMHIFSHKKKVLFQQKYCRSQIEISLRTPPVFLQ